MLIPALIIFIAIILLLFIRKQKENYTIVNLKRKKGDKEKMLELAKNFIDKNSGYYKGNFKKCLAFGNRKYCRSCKP